MAWKGIYKRGNTWWICYAALDGKIIRKSTGSDKYKEAELMLHTEKKVVQEGKPERKLIANYSFEELEKKYTEWMTGRHKSADSKAYRIKQMVSRFGSLPPQTL